MKLTTLSNRFLTRISFAVVFLMAGCGRTGDEKVTLQGEITTVVKNAQVQDTGGGQGSVAKGTWCCQKCDADDKGKVKCTGCTTTDKASCSGSGSADIRLDCPGTTTEKDGTVTCF
jgi:hypothetical protein